jgi:two-component system LytT family response regulator
MNCIIVEDNKMQRIALKLLVSQLDSLTLIAECENPIQAINVLEKEEVDLILLDIEMPKMTGLEFLKSRKKRPLIILITAKKDYALEAFEYNVVDYLLKPIKEDRFIKAVDRAKELFENSQGAADFSNKEFVFVRHKGVLTKIEMEDIIYIQALGDYVTIHTATSKYTVHLSLLSLEEKLPENKFFRIHRSYIVALNKVDSVEGTTASVKKNQIPIGDVYHASLLKKLNLL